MARVDGGAPPLRDEARAIIRAHCGHCHVGGDPKALPRALAIFDLDSCEWSAHMSVAQLGSLLDRLDMPPGEGPPGRSAATKEERATVERFVVAERARRSAK
jgi:hypothetical protein